MEGPLESMRPKAPRGPRVFLAQVGVCIPVVKHGRQTSLSSPVLPHGLAHAGEKAPSLQGPPTFTAPLDLLVLLLVPEAELLFEMPTSSSLAAGRIL